MKRKNILFRAAALALTLCMALAVSGCSKMEEMVSDSVSTVEAEDNATAPKGVAIPEIKSDDTVMPNYFDISLYDEENYADIYLGKKFSFSVTYCGSSLTVPSTLKQMNKEGWRIAEDSGYSASSTVLAGTSVEVSFVNDYDNQIIAVFYNAKNSSQSLKKCELVKFKIPENVLDNPQSPYGQFWVNGISNESAITDIVEYLGAPSHFYAVSETEYYLDYFIDKKDRRSGITVYVDTADDGVHAIEFSYY